MNICINSCRYHIRSISDWDSPGLSFCMWSSRPTSVNQAVKWRNTCRWWDVSNLEAQAVLLGLLGFGGAGRGAVQGAAAASCRTQLAAFPKHLPLALCALEQRGKKGKEAKCLKAASSFSVFMDLSFKVLYYWHKRGCFYSFFLACIKSNVWGTFQLFLCTHPSS